MQHNPEVGGKQMPVSEWIKKAREEKGLTQQQLADKSGFSKRAIAYWGKDQRGITIDNLQSLFNAIGIKLTIGIDYGAQ